MRRVRFLGDVREVGNCIHCGGPAGTLDHVPSKIFLDEPLPANIDGCAACLACNNALGLDEEYVACILECAATGEIDPALVERSKVASVLRNSPLIVERLKRARTLNDGALSWSVESDRIRRVLLKLARGHATFELNCPCPEEPSEYWVAPLCTLTDERRAYFEGELDSSFSTWPEVGSRMLTRLVEGEPGVFERGWVLVQQNRYRYRLNWDDGVRVFIELRGYLACEVGWTEVQDLE